MSPVHTYGEKGEAYPVQDGQVWRCGAHQYVCSDLMDSTTFRDWLTLPDAVDVSPPMPTLMYTDPPWGQGLANGFRTRAGLGRAEYDWTEIYREVADIAETWDIPLWAECSSIDTQIGMKVPGSIGRRRGATFRGYHAITYFGGNPAGLYYAHRAPQPDLVLSDNRGFKVVEQVLELYPQGVVIDPCSGLGGVPLTAQKLGWSSVTNELAPHRVSSALSRMSKTSGHEPERIA